MIPAGGRAPGPHYSPGSGRYPVGAGGWFVAPHEQSSPLPTPTILIVSGWDNTHDLGLLPPAMGHWGRVPGSLATGRDPRSAAWLELGRIMCLRDVCVPLPWTVPPQCPGP